MFVGHYGVSLAAKGADRRIPLCTRICAAEILILVREQDEHMGFGELIKQHLADPRGKDTRVPLADLPRQSVYSRLAGYEDVNDAERLSQDPRKLSSPGAAAR